MKSKQPFVPSFHSQKKDETVERRRRKVPRLSISVLSLSAQMSLMHHAKELNKKAAARGLPVRVVIAQLKEALLIAASPKWGLQYESL